MSGAVVIILLAAAALMEFIFWRRRRAPPPVAPAPVPAPVTNLGEAVAEMRPQTPEDELVYQVNWLCQQRLIEADSILETVQVARSTITHVGSEKVRNLLDDLERQALSHPEGVPGPVVANARLEFDRLMRSNLQ
jgi:hypothetical protein